jgi:hypothetical protein
MLARRDQAAWVKLARDEHAATGDKWKSAVFTVFERRFRQSVERRGSGRICPSRHAEIAPR